MKSKQWPHLLLPGYLIFCCSVLPIQAWFYRYTAVPSSGTRRLVLVLDGVPYKTIAELHAEGCFRRFRSPARMITTFPSLTNMGMIEILQTEDSPGYEDHYYDRAHNRLLGNIQNRLQGGKFIHGTFRETFDYHAPAFNGALAYVAAPAGALLVAQFDLAAFRSAFERSASPVFVGYIGETDSLAHLGGEKALSYFLRTLDRALEELMAESERNGGRLEVEMFSDHGNHYTEYRHVKLNDAIDQAGFVTEKSLNSARSVVLPKYGLVGSSMLFTAPENRARLAEVCAGVEGVDFAVYQSIEASGPFIETGGPSIEASGAGDGVIELISRRGRARLFRKGGRGGADERYRYLDLGGDPLSLRALISAMKVRGQIDEDGFASREDWWQATCPHHYVDPLRRLFDGFEKHVKNRADVIVSYQDGYELGSPFLSYFAQLRATHGNLLRGESEGFAISTSQNLDDAVRGCDLHRLFSLGRRPQSDSYFGSYFSGGGHCRLGPAMARALTGEGAESF